MKKAVLFFDLARGKSALFSVSEPVLGAMLATGTIPSLRVCLLGILAALAGYLCVYSLNDLLDLRADRLAGDRATGLSVKLVHEPGTASPDFAKVAAESGLTPKETEFFDLRSAVSGVDAGQQFNLAAFSLSPEVPFSDPVHGTNGYYVLEYVASKPSEMKNIL